MLEEIVRLLSSRKINNLTLDEMSSLLGVEKEKLESSIELLMKEGLIYHDKNDRYMLISNTSFKKGIIKVTKRKGPIVVFEDKTELDLLYKDFDKVKHNDIVLVEPYNKSGNAKLIKVIDRKISDIVCEVVKEKNHYKAVSNTGEEIFLKDIYPLGTKLLIDGKTREVKEVLGHKDDPSTKSREVLAEHDFLITFSREYLEELESIPSFVTDEAIYEEISKGRHDLRKIPFVTIDGDDTKDFDDAVSFVDGILYVAIADLNYITEGTVMFKDTVNRGISVYTPGEVNPMLHHKISNGICSLIPGEDRLTVSSSIKMDSTGKILSHYPGESIINSRMRMTYETVNLILECGIDVPEYQEYIDMIKNLYETAMIFKKKMLRDGFLEFSSKEVKFFFENNRLLNIGKRHQGKAEELIEFLMLTYNLSMTSYCFKHGLPLIMRNHDEPNQEKLTNWVNLLRQRGYKIEKKKHYTSEDIKEILKLYKGSEEQVILDEIAIRCQSKAKYSAYNIGHYALGQEGYATFSSPIRRLADFINQRVYKDSLKFGDKYAKDKWEKRIPYLAKAATDAELRAIKVERTMENIKKAEYMSNCIGNTYASYVTEVTESFIRVILPNMIEGIAYINKKEYHLSKDGFSLISNNGDRILVGDSANVKLIKADKNTGDIVFFREIPRVKEYGSSEEKTKKKVKSR